MYSSQFIIAYTQNTLAPNSIIVSAGETQNFSKPVAENIPISLFNLLWLQSGRQQAARQQLLQPQHAFLFMFLSLHILLQPHNWHPCCGPGLSNNM